MDYWTQRDPDGIWLYRDAGHHTGYRVARFEDDEELRYFYQWFRLLPPVVSAGTAHQALLFDDGPYREP